MGIARELGLNENSQVISAPSATVRPMTAAEPISWEQPLSAEQHYLYRRRVGKLRYAVPERLDLAFAVQRLSRELSCPIGASMARLKKRWDDNLAS